MQPKWIDSLERRFGEWAVPQLALFLVGMNAFIWVLAQMRPAFPSLLTLEPELVMAGQVWRLFTFLLIPPPLGGVWMLLWLYLLLTYGQALENEWGDFRFNLFYGIGALATIAGSLYLGQGLSNMPLNTGIFLAFAALYPDYEILIFFILPMKVKWIAALAWAGVAWSFLWSGAAGRVALAAGVANYLLFFGPMHWAAARHRYEVWRNRRNWPHG